MVQKGFNDLASFYPALAKEWDAEKNGALSPEAVTPASNRKAWWKCPLGHSYSAVISSRALRGSDCPYCAGSKALAGFNDLAAKAPDVAAQWHPTLNGNLTPEMVTPGSHRRVAVPPGAYVESVCLFPHGGAEVRLCRDCRQKLYGR